MNRLDPDNQQLQRVGVDAPPGSVKVEHAFPMRSLDKASSEDELSHFIINTTAHGRCFIAQPKLDGSALSLEYRRGRLICAATRGNGERGEDVTANARRIPNIPFKLDWEGDCHVRGEVVMLLDTYRQKYADIAPNPRNLAAGALRQKHLEKGKARAADLSFFAYDVRFTGDADRHPDSPESPWFKSDSAATEWLEAVGISIAGDDMVEADDDESVTFAMVELTRRFSAQRETLPFEIDGVVFKLDDYEKRKLLGTTAHHPRWALAWKFPPEEATTILLAVEWQTGRTGAVTPVGRVAPVAVSGVTVENVTLHNLGEVERLGVSIGEKVRIVRRGDVIPKIIETLGPASAEDAAGRFHSDGEPFIRPIPEMQPVKIPSACADCSTLLVTDGAFLRCTNLDCAARLVRSITYWCRALEMDGLGEKLAQQLCATDLVRSLADLYRLTLEQLSQLDRMGLKSAQNILSEFEQTRSLSLSKFIHALGLPGIGPELAHAIAINTTSLNALLKLVETKDDSPGKDESGKPYKQCSAIRTLAAIDGIGQTVAVSLLDGLAARWEVVHQLAQVIEVRDESPQELQQGPLSGQTFCITGSLSKSRKEIALRIKAAGGKVVSSVSGKLDNLVAGENAGSKFDKAQRLRVRVLSEQELNRLLDADEPDSNSSAGKSGQRTLTDF